MKELPEVAAYGDATAYPSQAPEYLVKVSERACPAGWDLNLVRIGGQPWGVCWPCGMAYRIASGVLMCIPVISPEVNRALRLGRLTTDVITDETQYTSGSGTDWADQVRAGLKVIPNLEVRARLQAGPAPGTQIAAGESIEISRSEGARPGGDQSGWARRPGKLDGWRQPE